jgi:hypothetical protein
LFETLRGLAVSLVSAGMGMAPITMSPLAAWLISAYDLDVPHGAASPDTEPQSDMSVREAIRSPQFMILLLTNFFCCATHSGPIFHTVSYPLTCGIPMIAAVSISKRTLASSQIHQARANSGSRRSGGSLWQDPAARDVDSCEEPLQKRISP